MAYSYGDYQYKCELYQLTPLLHFQSGKGVTLRASEVKPKLDRFILQQLGGWKEAYEKHPDWFINEERPALNYKMKIIAPETGLVASATEKAAIAPSYFGNMGEQSNPKTAIIYEHPHKLVITCFIPGLMKYIVDGSWGEGKEWNLRNFFWFTNFGTRSNKGFGGFSTVKEPDENDSEAKDKYFWDVHDALCEVLRLYKVGKLYYVDYFGKLLYEDELKALAGQDRKHNSRAGNKCKCDTCFLRRRYGRVEPSRINVSSKYAIESGRMLYLRSWQQLIQISELYRLLKTGFNNGKTGDYGQYAKAFIYQYAHRFGISAEKAWMKIKGISPNISSGRAARNSQQTKKFRFVRSILGVGESLRYKSDRAAIGWETISIKLAGIDRVPSPLVFKVIGGGTFILPFEQSSEVISESGVECTFSNESRERSGSIPTLTTSDGITVADLMKAFAEYVNNRGIDNEGNINENYLSHELSELKGFSVFSDFKNADEVIKCTTIGGESDGK